MINSALSYQVGPLLYCPALNRSVAGSLAEGKFGTDYSLALCLEDSIDDRSVPEAEQILLNSLHELYNRSSRESFYLPKIFIRVREPQQIPRLVQALGSARPLLAGFIIAKIMPDNAGAYFNEIRLINKTSEQPLYIMPIIENTAIVDLRRRYDILYRLKEQLDTVSELILNVRVGGKAANPSTTSVRSSISCPTW